MNLLARLFLALALSFGAGSLVPPGKRLESGWLYVGNPVKKVRVLTGDELAWFRYSAEHYMRLAAKHDAARSA